DRNHIRAGIHDAREIETMRAFGIPFAQALAIDPDDEMIVAGDRHRAGRRTIGKHFAPEPDLARRGVRRWVAFIEPDPMRRCGRSSRGSLLIVLVVLLLGLSVAPLP